MLKLKSKDWINIYNENNPPGFIAICESGRPDFLTYFYKTKQEADLDMQVFESRTGNKCLAIIEVKFTPK